MKDNQDINLAVFGSRSLRSAKAKDVLELKIKEINPITIITAGEIQGICEMARDICKREGIPLKLFFPEKKKYARGAYHHRSIRIINEADLCLLIHDGKSKGTLNELDLIKKYKKPYIYELIKPEANGWNDWFALDKELSIDFEIEELF